MKGIGGYVVTALVLMTLGGMVVAGGLVERRLASAQEALASLDFVETAAAYDDLERYAGYARYMPWIARGTLNQLDARRAAVRYWTGDYEALDAATSGINGDEEPDVETLFLAANAVYRLGQVGAPDREGLLRALDSALSAYAVVLRSSPGHVDAAFNYEYLTRVRGAIATEQPQGSQGSPTGSDPFGAPTTQSLHGWPGGPPDEQSPDEFQIHVPMEEEERQGTQPGGDQLRRRKG
jgi:hypothetical protein